MSARKLYSTRENTFRAHPLDPHMSGANPRESEPDGTTALHLAAGKGFVEVMIVQNLPSCMTPLTHSALD